MCWRRALGSRLLAAAAYQLNHAQRRRHVDIHGGCECVQRDLGKGACSARRGARGRGRVLRRRLQPRPPAQACRQPTCGARHACVVNQDVDLLVLGDDRLHRGLARCWVGDIQGHQVAAERAERPHRGDIARGGHDAAAARGERPRQVISDATFAAAGDQDHRLRGLLGGHGVRTARSGSGCVCIVSSVLYCIIEFQAARTGLEGSWSLSASYASQAPPDQRGGWSAGGRCRCCGRQPTPCAKHSQLCPHEHIACKLTHSVRTGQLAAWQCTCYRAGCRSNMAVAAVTPLTSPASTHTPPGPSEAPAWQGARGGPSGLRCGRGRGCSALPPNQTAGGSDTHPACTCAPASFTSRGYQGRMQSHIALPHCQPAS